MDLLPKQLQELSEASISLSSNDAKTKINSMRQIIHFYGKGKNCISTIYQVSKFDPKENISLRRFRNILTVEYDSNDSSLTSDVISSILADFDSKDPLIKSMAVRQAGFFSTNDTSPKLIPIILKASQMDDPYIRKTAALSILKVYQNNPHLISQYNLDLTLNSLLDDENPNVIANTISAITEINNSRSSPIIKISINSIEHMLKILEEATEWAQIQIIDFITENMPPNSEAVNELDIVNQLYTRLYIDNPGLTMSTVRCCLKMCLIKKDNEWTKSVLTKIMPPFIFLLNNRNEIQYVVLRSVTLILHKYKSIFSDNVDFFFCKDEDPSYIKSEKLDIIMLLSNETNTIKILNEIIKYTHDKDARISRKSIQIIGKLALMYQHLAENCVDKIISLIQSPEVYIVQECVVISVNILRKYPLSKNIDNLISAICMNFNAAVDDHHRSKAAMAWILGEYAGMITNAAEHIQTVFLDNFLEEPTDVQLSTLTAIVKYYLIYPEEGQEMLQKVLTLATNSIDNPDLKDHALIYLSILTECSENAVDLIMSKKNKKLIQEIRKNSKDSKDSKDIENSEDAEYSEGSKDDIDKDEDLEGLVLTLDELKVIDQSMVDQLLPLIGSLAVMYKQLPETFIPKYKISKELSTSPSPRPFVIPSSYTPIASTSRRKSNIINSPSHQQENHSTPLLSANNSKYKQKMHKNMMNINFNTTNSNRHNSTKRSLNLPRDFGSWSEEERNIHDIAPGSMPSGIVSSHQRNKSVNYAHYIYNNEYNFNYNINNLENSSYLNSSDASEIMSRPLGKIQISNQKRAPEMLDDVLDQQQNGNDYILMQSNENLKVKKKSSNDMDDIFETDKNNSDPNSTKS